MTERCPRCGVPAGAVAVTFWLLPDQARLLERMVGIVRRELALPSDGEALLRAASRAALEAHQGVSPSDG